jgi:hypothetical protein
MTRSSAPPSRPCVGTWQTLLLQRRRLSGDCQKLRTVLRLSEPGSVRLADEMVRLARRIDPNVDWRVAPERRLNNGIPSL